MDNAVRKMFSVSKSAEPRRQHAEPHARKKRAANKTD